MRKSTEAILVKRTADREGIVERVSAVLVIGSVRPGRRADLDGLLAGECVQARVFRQGETVALLVDGPRAERRFLHMIEDEGSSLARVVDCLDDVPLVPRELRLPATG